MKLDIENYFKELSEKAEQHIIDILNQYDPKKIFYALIASTYIPVPDIQLSAHSAQHPIFSLEILGRLILDRNFSGTEDFFYPEVLDQLSGYLRQYSASSFQAGSMNNITSHIKQQHALVRGNAFPWQTKERINNLFHRYDKIIQNKLGISLDKIMYSVGSYSDVVIKKVQKSRGIFASSQELESIVSSITEKKGKFVFTQKDGSKIILGNQDKARQYVHKIFISNFIYKDLLISEENCQDFSLDADEFKAIMSLIGVSKDTLCAVNDIRYYPLFQIDNESILITQNSALDAVLYHLDNLLKAEYGEKFKKHKSTYTENVVFESLCRIFPSDSIYRNVSYPDPTKNCGKSSAELDIAVKYGRFLILCEVKSKQLRGEALSGDPYKLRPDLKANIEDSYMQGQRAIKYIESVDVATFKEIKSQRTLQIKKEEVDKIYIISACYEPLSDIGTRLNHLQDLSLFRDKNYPFSISTIDLEIISHTSIYPASLLHYIERRLAILQDSTEWLGDELDFYPAYLDSRLPQANMGLPEEKPLAGLCFSGYSDVFEDLEGSHGDKPQDALRTLSLRLPEGVSELFKELNNANNDSAKSILFKLHEFKNESLYKIICFIKKLKTEDIPFGQVRSFFFQDMDCAVNIVGTSFESNNNLSLKVQQRLLFEKYRRKCNKSVAFAVDTRTPKLIEFAQYLEFEWSFDEEMEKMIAQDNRGVMAISGKHPGRNEKCLCGSGKKFKKCCLPLLG